MTSLSFPKGILLGKIFGKEIYKSKLEVDISILSLLTSSLFPKFFFKQKDSTTKHLALGCLLSLPSEIALSQTLDIRMYGALEFDTKPDPIWEGYAHDSFFIPKYEIIEKDKKTIIYHYTCDNDPKNLLLNNNSLKPEKILLQLKENLPKKNTWQRLVEGQKNQIKAKHLHKIVLCRKSIYTLSQVPSFRQVISNLLKVAHSHVFGYIITKEKGFFGASPESLFTRKKNLLKTEAIAGTRKRGKTSAEDKKIEDELRNNPKDLKEFSIVKEAIEKCLHSFSNKISIEKLSVYKNLHIQHLHTKFSAKTISDSYSIIKALHPTPAIGGLPKEKAILSLLKLELFSRRLYCSAIGIKGNNEEVFAVAIRSILIESTFLHLFAGVGIVEASDPLKEWEELNLKANAILNGVGFESQ